jgi:hypothetical protein
MNWKLTDFLLLPALAVSPLSVMRRKMLHCDGPCIEVRPPWLGSHRHQQFRDAAKRRLQDTSREDGPSSQIVASLARISAFATGVNT